MRTTATETLRTAEESAEELEVPATRQCQVLSLFVMGANSPQDNVELRIELSLNSLSLLAAYELPYQAIICGMGITHKCQKLDLNQRSSHKVTSHFIPTTS